MLNKIIEFIKEKFRKSVIAKNSIIVLTGEGYVSVLQLICLSLMVKTLGLELSGIVVIIQSYSDLFYTIFSFQSYNAIITFIMESIEKKDYKRTKQLIKQTFVQDMAACIISIIIAFACIVPVSKMMGWNTDIQYYLKFFILIIFVSNKSSLIGMLRLYNKFAYSEIANMIANTVKFMWFICGFINKRGIIYFLTGEFLLSTIYFILLLIFTINIMNKNKVLNFMKESLKLNKDFVVFNLYNNLVSTADIPVTQLTAFIVNKYLGFSDVAVYKTIQKLGALIQKIILLIRDVVFPEISKLAVKNDYKNIRRLKNKFFVYSNYFGIFILLIMLITSKLWLHFFMPDTYENIFILLFYIIYIIFTCSATVLHILFMTFNLVKYNMPIILISNGIYIVAIYLFKNNINLFSLIGMLFVQAIIVLLSKYIILKKKYNI